MATTREVQRYLINKFSRQVHRALVVGMDSRVDVGAWRAARVSYVRGVDPSLARLRGARERLGRLDDPRDPPFAIDFEQHDGFGFRPFRSFEIYATVSCMFAVDTFYVSESTLKMFLKNVADNLGEGGHFIGIVADGKRVLRGDMGKFHLVREGKPETFGTAFYIPGPDGGTTGFLAFFKAFQAIAAKFGLVPEVDFFDASLFEEADRRAPFKHLRADPAYAAFVFRRKFTPPQAP